ncbi:MAG TPA: hypothetical protein PLE43_09125 [Alphaproteobacteria bacterium]|mgnify:CR=1 FL=1|nr:hypothetical protein [Micavibrio sp.]HRK98621.1 hypothetical protein [Alphaproteobacteria bacterium]
MELNTTLLRERFVIRDMDSDGGGSPESLVAMSNRLVVPLLDSRNKVIETFVVRSRIMHSAIRMAAQIIQSYVRLGPLMARSVPFDFVGAWELVRSAHDTKYCEDPWVCVYHNAKPIFLSGHYHPFLDVIEKCDVKNPGNYDSAVAIAEDTFKKMGRHISISHNSNIGMVAHVKDEVGRCGMILRNPHKSTTFNFVAERRDAEFSVSPTQCLNACAAFLEGIQLSVRLGMNNEKIHQRLANSVNSSEALENISALARMGQLTLELDGFNSVLDVHYRPERPNFSAIAKEAEAFQRQLICSERQ